jgi:hypothetical protein
MDCSALYAAIDAKPFRPFKIELVSGRQVDVRHPENVMILPDRNRVHLIEVARRFRGTLVSRLRRASGLSPTEPEPARTRPIG